MSKRPVGARPEARRTAKLVRQEGRCRDVPKRRRPRPEDARRGSQNRAPEQQTGWQEDAWRAAGGAISLKVPGGAVEDRRRRPRKLLQEHARNNAGAPKSLAGTSPGGRPGASSDGSGARPERVRSHLALKDAGARQEHPLESRLEHRLERCHHAPGACRHGMVSNISELQTDVHWLRKRKIRRFSASLNG